jgi:hypothetical protein
MSLSLSPDQFSRIRFGRSTQHGERDLAENLDTDTPLNHTDISVSPVLIGEFIIYGGILLVSTLCMTYPKTEPIDFEQGHADTDVQKTRSRDKHFPSEQDGEMKISHVKDIPLLSRGIHAVCTSIHETLR